MASRREGSGDMKRLRGGESRAVASTFAGTMSRRCDATMSGAMRRVSPILVLAIAAGSGCLARQQSPGVLIAFPATSPIVLDGRHSKDEWAICKYGGSVGHSDTNTTRHAYIRCVYDREHLYLAVRTHYDPSYGTKRTLYREAARTYYDQRDGREHTLYRESEPVDIFPVRILSENKEMVLVEIASDGSAYSWRRCDEPTRERVESFIRREYGLAVSVVVDDRRLPKGRMQWFAEIMVPLDKLRPLGRRLWLNISGKLFRLDFYNAEALWMVRKPPSASQMDGTDTATPSSGDASGNK